MEQNVDFPLPAPPTTPTIILCPSFEHRSRLVNFSARHKKDVNFSSVTTVCGISSMVTLKRSLKPSDFMFTVDAPAIILPLYVLIEIHSPLIEVGSAVPE